MSTQISPLHQAARDFAAAGIKVFPCEEGGKRPVCENGFHDATTDLGQIDAWWGQNADYNLALCPEDAGWCVVDVDPGAEPLDLPDTYTVKTPRDGRHFYFTGSLPSTVGKIAAKIDTRGRGGYVLVPPSVVNGSAYEVLHEREIIPVPVGIEAATRVADSPVKAVVADVDLPDARRRARSLLLGYVREGDVAIEGQGGNARTYRLAAEVQNLGLTADVALDLIDEIWNPHCLPPWDRDELGVLVSNASRYAQNEAGAWAVEPAEKAFSKDALDRVLADAPPARRSRFYPEDDDDMDKTPDARWLFEGIIQDASTVMLYGKTQSFKTFIASALALGAATGKDTLGFKPLLTGPTFYGALEGRADLKRKRRPAWRLAHEVEGKTEFYVLPAPMIVFDEEQKEFVEEIAKRLAGRKPRLIVLDTVSKMMVGLDPTRDAPRLIRFCDNLVEAFGCSVIALHHTGHDEKRGPRDSSAYHAGFDTVIELHGDHKAKVTRMTVLKHKDAEEPADPFHFHGRLVGPSLVFFPIAASEYRKITAEEDAYDPRKIGAALQKLLAYGKEQAVTTLVLATELLPMQENEAEDIRAAALKAACRRLNALAKERLAAYADRVGNENQWFLPASALEPVE